MTDQHRQPQQATMEERTYQGLGRIASSAAFAGTWLDKLFKPLFKQVHGNDNDWAKNAEIAAEMDKLPRARALLYIIVIAFIALLIWAAFAPIDQVTRGDGKVIPSKQLQVVQSMDGGVVEEIAVREGQFVHKGDLLVRIDPTRFVANYEESSVRAKALRAKVERLRALVRNEPYEPEINLELPLDQRLMLEQEQHFYYTSLAELDERVSIAKEQRSQRLEEFSEVQARLSQAQRNYDMASQELEITRPLLEVGAISEVEILRLERDVSQAKGDMEQAVARLAVSRAAIEEADARIREAELSMRNQWRALLTEASSELNSLGKNVSGLEDRVKTTSIRAPDDGVIQRMMFNTLGGVVQPGNVVAEIVPADDKLLVEAKIQPSDIAFLRPGLPAVVKFHAYDFTVFGGMQAELVHISADTITDERDNTFYLVRAATEQAGLGKELPIIPGMTVQLDILTGKKTILSYLLKPILRAKANALGER